MRAALQYVMPVEREVRLERALFRGEQLTLDNPAYSRVVRGILETLLHADLDPRDLTVAALGIRERSGSANVVAREPGAAAGLEEYAYVMRKHGLKVTLKKVDGDVFETGEILVRVEGGQNKLLSLERVGLNLLQRMCGIATNTARLQERARRRCPATRILGTRKTPWGLLDKRAIHLGGGGTHRLGLGDGIVIKNNHLALLARREEQAVPLAIGKAWTGRRNAAFIEVEVRSEESAIAAGREFKRLLAEEPPTAGADVGAGAYAAKKQRPCPCLVMLDNLMPEDVRNIIVAMRKNKVWEGTLVEASGGISETNFELYADAEVDAISIGAITHSARALDLSQRME
jgi:nicotinate-nucleotide pyrophosphorylase (carboxylating)